MKLSSLNKIPNPFLIPMKFKSLGWDIYRCKGVLLKCYVIYLVSERIFYKLEVLLSPTYLSPSAMIPSFIF